MSEKIYLEKGNRFYSVEFQTDLFGGLNIIQTWGSLVRDWQRQKVVPVSSEEEGNLVREAIVLSKIKRGYWFIDEVTTKLKIANQPECRNTQIPL